MDSEERMLNREIVILVHYRKKITDHNLYGKRCVDKIQS